MKVEIWSLNFKRLFVNQFVGFLKFPFVVLFHMKRKTLELTIRPVVQLIFSFLFPLDVGSNKQFPFFIVFELSEGDLFFSSL